jgi:hypothetical protein
MRLRRSNKHKMFPSQRKTTDLAFMKPTLPGTGKFLISHQGTRSTASEVEMQSSASPHLSSIISQQQYPEISWGARCMDKRIHKKEMSYFKITLQFSTNAAASGWFSPNASPADASYSSAYFVCELLQNSELYFHKVNSCGSQGVPINPSKICMIIHTS